MPPGIRPTAGTDVQPQPLARTFDDVAELYERSRPTYPTPVFDDLVALARLHAGARVVEVGCGTGQATLPLAKRGLRITCVELGERLAAVSRRNLAAYPGVDVITADFATWQPATGAFDAVVAFTAFHWIAPEVRYTKAASLLGDRGTIAVVTTQHVLPPDGDDFFVEVQEDYEAVVPDDPATKAGPPAGPDTIPDLGDEIADSGLFRNLAARRYLWDVTYTPDAYVRLLETYSGHRALDGGTRKRLLDRIRRRAHARPDGRVRKTYLAILNVAEAMSAPPRSPSGDDPSFTLRERRIPPKPGPEDHLRSPGVIAMQFVAGPFTYAPGASVGETAAPDAESRAATSDGRAPTTPPERQ